MPFNINIAAILYEMLVKWEHLFQKSLTYSLVQSIGMNTKAINVPKGGWNTSWAKEVH